MAKHHAAQYNLVAKVIRDQMDFHLHVMPVNKREKLNCLTTCTNLALDFARHFKRDNELFDPIRFMDACSPDAEHYPLSELWSDDEPVVVD